MASHERVARALAEARPETQQTALWLAFALVAGPWPWVLVALAFSLKALLAPRAQTRKSGEGAT